MGGLADDPVVERHGKRYAAGTTISPWKIYPFFLIHMAMFGASGFFMAYGTADDIDFEIKGSEAQFVEIELDPGESVVRSETIFAPDFAGNFYHVVIETDTSNAVLELLGGSIVFSLGRRHTVIIDRN